MTLSESRIRWMWSEAHNDTSDRMAYQVLAAMVEAEVRKEHEALVRQTLEALEGVHQGEHHGGVDEAINATRARLKENGGNHATR